MSDVETWESSWMKVIGFKRRCEVVDVTMLGPGGGAIVHLSVVF